MTRFLLDTNAASRLIAAPRSRVVDRIKEHLPGEICISAIVSHELYFGAFKSQAAQRYLRMIEGLQLEIVEFDQDDARCSGEVRALLARQGTPIGPLDVLIAGQALSRGLILVTHNSREFQRVPNLQIQDWEADVPDRNTGRREE